MAKMHFLPMAPLISWRSYSRSRRELHGVHRLR